MIKFFRKIRRELLTENKLSNYLVYAIGEIILVVIGILIALQINTANQNRQRAKLEKVLLKQVKTEMLSIYADMWRDAARLEIGEKSNANINKFIAQNAPYTDSLCFDFHWIKFDEYIYPTDAAYSKLKEEGLDIIKNDSIRLSLQELYETHFPRIMKNNSFTPDISEVFDDYYLDAFKPNTDYTLKFSAHLENDTVGGEIFSDVHYLFPRTEHRNGTQYTAGYVPLNFETLKKDTKFHMLLERTKRFRDIKLKRYSLAENQIKEVIRMIDRVLE